MTWKTFELGEVCDLITCGVAKRPDYVENGIPFLSARNVKEQKIIWDNHMYITPKAHQTLTKYNKPEIGDVLYTRVGSFGEAAIIDKDVEFSIFVSLTLIKPKQILLSKFLVYYLNSPFGKILAKNGVSSSGVGNLNVGVVRKFPIPLPSIVEQQRIVAKLDAAFTEIDKTIEITDYKISNYNELSSGIIREVLNNNFYRWETKNLSQLSENLDTKRVPITKSKRVPGSVPYYGASGIVDYVEGYLFDDNILLISEDGANLLMRTYPIAFSVSGKCWVNNHAHVLKFKNPKLQEWVELYLNATNLSPYISGMAQPKLNQKKLNEIPIPLPNIEMLDKLLKIVMSAKTNLKKILLIEEKKMKELKNLKSSILAQELQSKFA